MSGFSLQEFMRRDQVFDIVNAAQSERLNVDKQILLYLEGLSVSFDGFKAINDLNLYIRDGELRCIIGPNGAGKTTMMDIITGKTKPDTGTAYFGQTIDLLNMDEPAIAEAGIGRKFQKPTVFENLSVFANLELAMAQNRDFISLYTAKLSSEQSDRIADVQQLIGLAEHSFKLAGALSHGQKQWLEIGMLLMQRPRLLLVDEPVAGMTHQEMDKTAELLISLAGKHSVVVVEHDMEFVRNLAEGGRTVSVLHQGSVLAEGTMDQVQNDDRVKQVYLGE
ncbi:MULTISPECIES: urea ABC transporter ATP-binding protein UrtD [unclassified Marinobacterium]|jgi:urea transport system ATP-binding protein|uniref:urea ABC transporter ATP-binding protein UrtD n=1 Tax=unclassified Marinobacterium TaxID=2644139 RepID=UPI001569A477|nr:MULTISPECIES: urea ABC transporter ATP-binding protein UrtD [unclassified Marinobacterium]NRP27028.1 Lipopolysaccharide export system ATP-binding protein LptB [Marinobacterium sp. xm-d-420]NRP52114.1 Lipopolysaccharide export system ATP-binding protein LptB [Marinobacterium sp. xm-v-242]NRP57168.1 Lipopolysaccharide export system ATP-binding protein LptB [Marinobacterium sp. xm-d-510]NRP76695.1 Lipopolysaccharide export system ATP-binding protein LptB [Marinobacterium sp. xm-m-383]NRP97582.